MASVGDPRSRREVQSGGQQHGTVQQLRERDMPRRQGLRVDGHSRRSLSLRRPFVFHLPTPLFRLHIAGRQQHTLPTAYERRSVGGLQQCLTVLFLQQRTILPCPGMGRWQARRHDRATERNGGGGRPHTDSRPQGQVFREERRRHLFYRPAPPALHALQNQ